MLKGLRDQGHPSPMNRDSYRIPWIQPEGAGPAFLHEARIIDINLSTWTVDVRTQFDRRYFLNVQVMSPYMHPTNGEGIYCFPDVGAKCYLAIPSDGPPPVVMGFVMPATTLGDVSSAQSPAGTTPSPGATTASSSTYAGGRPQPKPGDIYIKGRDGNFCILHRGGVLQIGSTALAQRLYIPLNNVLTDISQNYHHYNMGGSINWAVDNSGDIDKRPTCFKHSFRLISTDAKASVRVSIGTISDPVGLDPKAVGADEVTNEQIGNKANPLIYEVVIAPDAIGGDDGRINGDTRPAAVFQMAFDKSGGTMLWAAGSVVMATKKKLIMKSLDDMTFSTAKSLLLHADNSARVEGGKLLELVATIVRIGDGTDRVAFVGCPVTVSIPPGIPIGSVIIPPATVPIPVLSGGIPPGPVILTGVIADGKGNVLV